MATRRPALRLASTTSRALSTSASGSRESFTSNVQSNARDGLRGNAFAAAGEAEALRRGRLDADLGDVKARDLGDPRAHCGPKRANFGFFGNHGAVQMVDQRAFRAQQIDRMLQK